jgi:hypothetical protein
MIDKLDIASKNWADDYMTQFGRRFNNMLRDAFIAGFKKGVALSKEIVRCRECKYYEDECCWREIQFMNAPEPNAFCSYGERKEKDDARTD